MSESRNQKQIVKQVDEIFSQRWPKFMIPLPRTNKRGCAQRYAPLTAVVNEGKRSEAGHYQAKLAGLAKGFPDMQLMIARGGYHALFIENKHGKNVRSHEQIVWANQMNNNGYKCVECRTVDEAVKTVIAYMDGKL